MTTGAPPTFAVVVPVYNEGDHLASVIGSALEQSLPPVEVIVVDDGSTTLPDAVLVEAASLGATVIRSPHNGGPAAARNRGAENASASWLVFVDADSMLEDDALETFRDAITPDVGLVRAGCSLRDFPETNQHGFLPGTFAVRRSIFVEIGGYDEVLRFAENTELEWRIIGAMERLGLIAARRDHRTVVLREVGMARNYDAHRRYAAVHILDKHADWLSRDHEERARYESIVAVNAMRTEEWAMARRYAWRAVRSAPSNPKHAARLVVSLSGPLGGRWWIRRGT
jgi:glycosyltransferase involved in cell wall biosynthesis